MADEDAPDPDREAILLRRRRFLALALSTMVFTAGCETIAPRPCLSRIPRDGGPPDAGE